MRYGLIMAGGSGTRLWPMSRTGAPKQLLQLFGGRSLLQIAVDRTRELVEPGCLYLCLAEKFRSAVRRQIPEMDDARLLGEPEGRDTLAAAGLPAALLVAKDPRAVIAVFTADHLIEPLEVFQECLVRGFEIVEKHPETLVTFGIRPSYAATGFGWVERGAPLEGFAGSWQVGAFHEKPSASVARTYLESGRHFWNSGMFVWRAGTLLDCIRRYQPDLHAGLMRIASAWGNSGPGRAAVLEREYPKLKKISVDHGVLEPAAGDPAVRLAMVEMPVQWIDVGSWPALGETITPDARGNRLQADRVLLLDGHDNLVVSDRPDHLLALLGVENLIVVQTGRATFICPRDQVDRIRELHRLVHERFGEGEA